MDNLFDSFHVVSRYTDTQAVDDGVLVAVSAKDRVSRPAFDFLCNIQAEPEHKEMHAEQCAIHILAENGLEAIRVYEHNIGGGIFTTNVAHKTMWIIPNELGGLTLMFPEDY